MKYYIICLILILSHGIFAQQNTINEDSHRKYTWETAGKHLCAFDEMNTIQRKEIKGINEVVSEMRNGGNSCIPIKFHVVRRSDGSGGATLEEISIGLANLNYQYNSSNLEFFICGSINYIDNTTLYDYDSNEEATLCNSNDVGNAVNVYIVDRITVNGNCCAAGYAYYPFDNIKSTRILMIIDVMTGPPNSTFVHEFGHHYSIPHTHDRTEGGPNAPGSERVRRTGPLADCASDGDGFCDTDADPRYNNIRFDYGTCTYTGNEMDDQDDIYTPPVNNIMSYYPDACGGIFTPEQDAGILAGYNTRLGHTAYDFSCSATSVTAPTITSLSVDLNNQAVVIDWTDNSSNELGFLIERSSVSATSGFEPLLYGGTGANVTNFYDLNPASNTTYWY